MIQGQQTKFLRIKLAANYMYGSRGTLYSKANTLATLECNKRMIPPGKLEVNSLYFGLTVCFFQMYIQASRPSLNNKSQDYKIISVAFSTQNVSNYALFTLF